MIVAILSVEGGRKWTNHCSAPRWQLFVLRKTQIIILILGALLLHDMTALMGLCLERAQSTVLSSVLLLLLRVIASSSWFILQLGCTQQLQSLNLMMIHETVFITCWHVTRCHKVSRHEAETCHRSRVTCDNISEGYNLENWCECKPKHDPVSESWAVDTHWN